MPEEFAIIALDEEEVAIIRERREARAREARRDRVKLHYLKTAYEYERWLQDHGAGSSYSTFCDEFGYYTPEDMSLNRSRTYSIVQDLRCTAKEESEG